MPVREPRTDTVDSHEPAEPVAGTSRGWAGPARALVLRMHFYAGVLLGPFLVIVAVTGLLYVFSPQLESALYDRELHVPPGGSTMPLAEQINTARAALPAESVATVWPSSAPTDTTRVIFETAEENQFQTVFVNPYNAEIRGVLDTYGDSQSLPVRTWLDELHRELHLGDVGRLYSELAASWLWLVVGGGLFLWWRRRKSRSSKSERAVRGRSRTRRRHSTIGVALAVGLLFLSATGLSWSQFAGGNVTAVREALGWQEPTVSGDAGEHAEHGGGEHDHGHEHGTGGHAQAHEPIDADDALAAARTAGLRAPVEMAPPADATSTFVITEVKRSWPVRQDAVAIDQHTGAVVDVSRFEDWPLPAKLTRWGIDAHMGLLFGLANQIVLAVVATGLLGLVLLGYRMWWQRRPSQRGFGPPFPRGALRSLPPRVIVAFGLSALAVGVFLPLFGLSLLAFLALDSALGWWARTRRNAA